MCVVCCGCGVVAGCWLGVEVFSMFDVRHLTTKSFFTKKLAFFTAYWWLLGENWWVSGSAKNQKLL